jgi:hypothetical protein
MCDSTVAEPLGEKVFAILMARVRCFVTRVMNPRTFTTWDRRGAVVNEEAGPSCRSPAFVESSPDRVRTAVGPLLRHVTDQGPESRCTEPSTRRFMHSPPKA